jgi:hypothetical protein
MLAVKIPKIAATFRLISVSGATFVGVQSPLDILAASPPRQASKSEATLLPGWLAGSQVALVRPRCDELGCKRRALSLPRGKKRLQHPDKSNGVKDEIRP